jgi:hypothetical protein
MPDNGQYACEPKAIFLNGVVILVAIVATVVHEIWQNPPGEGSAAMPTQTDTVR